MEPTETYRRPLIVAVAALMTAGGLVLAAPAPAQDAQQPNQPGGRYRVLVAQLTRQGEVDEGFGEDIVEAVRERIDQLATHAPVEEDALDDALDQYDLDEEDLDCVTGRQLANQMQVELVMCGEYQQAAQGVQVSARFVGATTGEAFEVEPFTAAEPEQAAQQIFAAFEQYVNQLRFGQFCLQDLQSQAWASALGRCNNALALNPNAQQALVGKGRALLELDSLEQSLATFQKVLELNPSKTDALLTAGIVATRLGQQDVARDYFHRYLELNPSSVEVRLKVATDVNNAGDPEGALQIAEEGLAQTPDNVTLIQYAGHFALAAAQEYETQPQGANGAPAQAPETDPTGTQDTEPDPGTEGAPLPPRADSLYNVALNYYRQAFELQGAEANVTMLGNMLNALVKLQRPQEAVDLGARVVAAKPNQAGLWSNYATALQRAGQLEQALTALDKVVELNPEYEAVYARRGNWLLEADRLDDAMTAFETAISRGDATADDVGRNIFVMGYNQKFKTDDFDAALDYFALARDFAESAQTDAMASFWTGYVIYNQAIEIEKPGTPESAQQALPMFQEALGFFEQSGPYAETQSSFELADFITGTNQYIERQQLIIDRGR